MTENNTTLGEFCDQSRKITYGIVQPGKESEGGVPIVRVNNFSGHSLNLSEKLQVAPEVEASYQRSRPKPGDLLISLVGSIGQVAIAPPEIEGWNLARAVGLVPFDDMAKAHWAAYAIQLKENQRFIRQRANTTVQATFNLKDLAEIPIPKPGDEVENAALRVLRMLDDKIELNRRMNETLEEMARALFRDWFVDFGPTRRQMAGETSPAAIMGHAFPPEKATPLAALFPAKLGDDGLPEGWVSEALGERVTVKRGGSPRPIKDFIRPNGIPWVKIADATRCDGPNLFVTREFIKEEGLKKTVELQPGSLILSNSATPGLPKFLRLRACIHDGWLYFPDTGGLSNDFLYLAFLHFKDAIVSQATGSVFNNLKTDVLKRQKFVFPPMAVLAAFDSVVCPLFAKILANEQENQTLAALRDLLLPKLMSGEIRLKDAEALT